MFADAQGNILDLPRNGMVTGVTARVALVDAWNGVWSFTDSMSRKSLLVMSTDKAHLLYVNDQFDLGAWERGTSTLSSPYTLADIAPSDWAGSVIGISASFELASLGPVHDANIDPVGNFQELTSVTKLTDLAPLALLEPANGQFDGDFTLDGSATTGRTLTLVTPDSHFLVVQTCPVGGTFPVDCRFSAWQRR